MNVLFEMVVVNACMRRYDPDGVNRIAYIMLMYQPGINYSI